MSSIFRFLLIALVTSLVCGCGNSVLAQKQGYDPTEQVRNAISDLDIGAKDCPQWQISPFRNNVVSAENIPLHWDVSSGENVKWSVQLGGETYGNPIIANGKVYVGTNNGAAYMKRYPNSVDLGVLLCFDEQTGKFLWQHSNEKLPTGRVHDWPDQGICSAPLVDGNRLWYVTNRGEVICLDTEGFYDGEDSGNVQNEVVRVADYNAEEDGYEETIQGLNDGQLSESLKQLLGARGEPVSGDVRVEIVDAGKSWKLTGSFNEIPRTLIARIIGPRLTVFKTLSIQDKHEADVVWRFDMMTQLGVSQHNMCSCSVTCFGDLMFVITGNGVDEGHVNLPSENAPSLICLRRSSGEILWTDNSPGANVLHGQWSSPAFAVIDEVPQVVLGAGDGWVYGFLAAGENGKSKLLWKFDCNPKRTVYKLLGADRNQLIATPVIYNDRVFIAVGEDPEHGEGEGHLWCIDPRKRGDISPTLVFNSSAPETPIPHKRLQALEEELGDFERPNPNIGAIWHYRGNDLNEFEETMHRTLGSVTIKNDLLFIADFSGVFHCVCAKTGKAHWTYDMFAGPWASPLIVNDRVYITSDSGAVFCFKVADEMELLSENDMQSAVFTTPVVANDTLFIANRNRLFALQEGAQMDLSESAQD